MAKYFNYFPKTLYTNTDEGNALDTVTNIISRFAFEESLKENTSAFYPYEISEGDTPEIIARKYYDNSERHWIVLMFNDIIDPQYDWPMDSRTLNEYVDKKYADNGGLSWAKNVNNVQAYYKITKRISSYDGTVHTEKVQITANAYANTAATSTNFVLQDGTTITEEISKQTKSYYDYEVDENEKKRTIKLLKPEFVSIVEKEFKKVIK